MEVLTANQWDQSRRNAAELVLAALDENDADAQSVYWRVERDGMTHALSASVAGLLLELATESGVDQVALRRWLASHLEGA